MAAASLAGRPDRSPTGSRLRTERTPPSLRFIRCEIIRKLSPRDRRSQTSRATDSGILLGAPNFLPSARARATPAWVRSRISSRSNSASAASVVYQPDLRLTGSE